MSFQRNRLLLSSSLEVVALLSLVAKGEETSSQLLDSILTPVLAILLAKRVGLLSHTANTSRHTGFFFVVVHRGVALSVLFVVTHSACLLVVHSVGVDLSMSWNRRVTCRSI
jgi:hypothetical protein